jgi:hypothetical protein
VSYDGSHPAGSARITLADEVGLTAVRAHTMLGTMAAARGAIRAAMEMKPPDRDGLLLLALRRLEFLTEQLIELAAGVPEDLHVLDEARFVLTLLDDVIDVGTAVELFTAFDRTWTPGFEIAGRVTEGYRVRRLSDGSLLPGYTSSADLRVPRAHR